jgi:hypothetical protein
MNRVRIVDLHRSEPNSSSINLLARSKKLPPPPLTLPGPNTTTDEKTTSNSNEHHEQKKPTNNCCLSSSSKDCPHKPVPYVNKNFVFLLTKNHCFDRLFLSLNVHKFLIH